MTIAPPSNDHSIEALCNRSHMISREKGWVNDKDERPLYTSIALMHSELSEALEEWRDHKKLDEKYYELSVGEKGAKMTETYSEEAWKERQRLIQSTHVGGELDGRPVVAKPCGIPIELADLVIRICQRVGTDGNAVEFSELCAQIHVCAFTTCPFEEFITDVHVDLSDAYSALLNGESMQTTLMHLAHAVQSTFSFCTANNVDLWAAIDEKEAYNRTRPMRHGGKKC
jgi:hypothetical protein